MARGGGSIFSLAAAKKNKNTLPDSGCLFHTLLSFQTRAYLILDTPERHFQQQQHENEKNDVDDDDAHPHESEKNFFLFCFLISTKNVWENRNERKKRITETKSRKKTHTHTHRRRHTHTSWWWETHTQQQQQDALLSLLVYRRSTGATPKEKSRRRKVRRRIKIRNWPFWLFLSLSWLRSGASSFNTSALVAIPSRTGETRNASQKANRAQTHRRVYTLRPRAARPSTSPTLKVTATATARGHFNKNFFSIFIQKGKKKKQKKKKSNGIHFFGVLKADDVRLRVAVAKM
jgi:hypothetical protein